VQVDEREEVPPEYVEAEVKRIREKLRQNYQLYMGNREHVNMKNRVVILVDDGVATGKTLISTIELIKKEQPRRMVVAVPVASPTALARIEGMVDEVVCLLAPPYFQAVGQFYQEFYQTSDELVIQLLQEQDKK
jgi:predicted phosphoribosyltransferase